MTAKQFTTLAIVAVVCAAAAIGSYVNSITWSSASARGAALFDNVRRNPPEIARIEVEQGATKATLERKGKDWVMKERDSFPADPEKVRALLQGMADAELVEPKTRKADRYALLALEDPKGKDAQSRLVRLVDAQGKTAAEAIVGNRRADAFGAGKGGTYVRRPGEEQTWLVNAEIEAGTTLREWINPQLVLGANPQVRSLSLTAPGQERIDIERNEQGAHTLKDIPQGMKIKYVNMIDDMIDAATSFSFEDVRRPQSSAAQDKVHSAVLKLDSGAELTLRLVRNDGVAWLSIAVNSAGAKDKAAMEALAARVKGWEFQVPGSKVESIFKSRDELLEKIAS
jgi:hypothetical protein